mmetsp:Transcript_5974/g.14150  ORF Transcript_5974/g.14150 Transcript_5974/m.14150 type:complete len:125 (-) Transcript_5974:2015-2389(-)
MMALGLSDSIIPKCPPAPVIPGAFLFEQLPVSVYRFYLFSGTSIGFYSVMNSLNSLIGAMIGVPKSMTTGAGGFTAARHAADVFLSSCCIQILVLYMLNKSRTSSRKSTLPSASKKNVSLCLSN